MSDVPNPYLRGDEYTHFQWPAGSVAGTDAASEVGNDQHRQRRSPPPYNHANSYRTNPSTNVRVPIRDRPPAFDQSHRDITIDRSGSGFFHSNEYLPSHEQVMDEPLTNIDVYANNGSSEYDATSRNSPSPSISDRHSDTNSYYRHRPSPPRSHSRILDRYRSERYSPPRSHSPIPEITGFVTISRRIGTSSPVFRSSSPVFRSDRLSRRGRDDYSHVDHRDRSDYYARGHGRSQQRSPSPFLEITRFETTSRRIGTSSPVFRSQSSVFSSDRLSRNGRDDYSHLDHRDRSDYYARGHGRSQQRSPSPFLEITGFVTTSRRIGTSSPVFGSPSSVFRSDRSSRSGRDEFSHLDHRDRSDYYARDHGRSRRRSPSPMTEIDRFGTSSSSSLALRLVSLSHAISDYRSHRDHRDRYDDDHYDHDFYD